MFARAAATNPGSPYVFLAWGQMRGVACANVAGARAVFNRGAELCPRFAASAGPICSSTPPLARLCMPAPLRMANRTGMARSYNAPAAEDLQCSGGFWSSDPPKLQSTMGFLHELTRWLLDQ